MFMLHGFSKDVNILKILLETFSFHYLKGRNLTLLKMFHQFQRTILFCFMPRKLYKSVIFAFAIYINTALKSVGI